MNHLFKVSLSLHYVPDLLPLRHDGVPVQLHRPPAAHCPDEEPEHVLASHHGNHPHHLDCQEQEHEGEIPENDGILAGRTRHRRRQKIIPIRLKLSTCYDIMIL